jgi:hypothetical protein
LESQSSLKTDYELTERIWERSVAFRLLESATEILRLGGDVADAGSIGHIAATGA